MGNANKRMANMMKNTKDMMQSNVTITEAVQISRGVAEDVLNDYHRSQANVQLSMSIQIELLKDIVIKAGLITEEDFREKYMQKAKELQETQMKMRAEAMKDQDSGVTEMKVSAGDVEVKRES